MMPPYLPRKPLRSDSPKPKPPSTQAKPAPAHPRRSKESVFDALDTPPTVARTLSQTKKFLEGSDDDEESSLSSPESSEDEFEDVPLSSTTNCAKGKQKAQDGSSSEESGDEEWEDALGTKHHTKSAYADEPEPVISHGDLQLTLSEPAQTDYSLKPDGKKGPSKKQRQIRNATHCMHVQFLMWHNTIRNAWIQDQEVQRIMVENMTTGCWKELDRYWRDAGIKEGHKRIVEGGWTEKIEEALEEKAVWKDSGQKGVQVYESPKKGKDEKTKKEAKPKFANKVGSKSKDKDARSSERNQRDWGSASDRLEMGTPNLSAGDPLLRLMKYLSAFWKAKFKITAPCLRKRGYLSPATLQKEILTWKEDGSDADAFGERVENLSAFRDLARKCHGSRDIGQQLFTALLRGLGIEARMVTSLQPVGFGFSQAEEGKALNLRNLKTKAKESQTGGSASTPGTQKGKGKLQTNGTKDIPIDLSDSDLSSAISLTSDSEPTTKTPKKKASKVRKYGEELPHPTYWTEAISNLTHTPIAVSGLPRTVISTSSTPDQLLSFYCRGAAADKAKQVFAYLIAYSSDGSAKDVTTRYLPKHQWPGKTKGFRMPAEKIAIHNKRGKVKRWEEWDWFISVLRPYARPFHARQPWDEVEDEGDLVPAKPTKPKDMDEEGGKETLQGYKNSAEYVLERHLRREEAIRPGAKIVRYFVSGKGDKEKSEPVYLRKDVEVCRSVESWHKEGREVKEGEQPLKYVPMRAVTVIRKREIEEREREEGGKIKQGLYSKAQTDWIIPDPIVDGKIPRNAFGNIDVYVPTMVPKGAVHVPLKGTARICRKLNIDHAEACTGFEFGKQRAVPILTGVVVAEENEHVVIDAWEAGQAEKAIKEADKKEKLVLGLWKKFFVGLRTVQRLKREYGEEVELPKKSMKETEQAEKKSEWDTFKDHEDFEGGFVRDEHGASDNAGGFLEDGDDDHGAGGFLRDDEDNHMAGGFFTQSQEEDRLPMGGMEIDHGDAEQPDTNQRKPIVENAYKTPISLASMHQEGVGEEEEEEQAEDASDSEEEKLPKPAPSRRGRRSTAQPKPGKGNKSKTTTSKSILDSQDEDEDSDISSPDSLSTQASDSDDVPLPPGRRPRVRAVSPSTSTPATRRSKRKAPSSPPPEMPEREQPKRKAAKKSEKLVKSHFFPHGSDDETDLTDLTDRSPVKKVGRGGRGRGQGRGGKRGKV